MGDLRKKRIGILFFTTIVFPFAGYANESDLNQEQAIQAALKARNQLVQRFHFTQTGLIFGKAIKETVAEGIRALKSWGQTTTANRYEREWTMSKSAQLDQLVRVSAQEFEATKVAASIPTPVNGNALYGVLGFQSYETVADLSSIRDLGDHRPLFEWMGTLLESVRDQQGTAALRQGIWDNIYIATYALPVVFAPKKGQWKQEYPTDKQWIEYRRHFIPLTNLATYYATQFACKQITLHMDVTSQFCEPIAGLFKKAMGRYAAPKISDYIFNKANHLDAKWTISAHDFVYQNADDVMRALQNN